MKNKFTIRALAVLLSALMLFGMLPVYAVEADDYICIEVENVTLDKGAEDSADGYYTVKVPIVITQNSGLISARFSVNHPESIELIGWENGEIFGESANLTPTVENNATKNGIIVYYSNGMSTKNVTATGMLITLIYNVPENIEPCDLDLTLKLMEVYKEDGVQSTLPEIINESCEIVDGVISVVESGTKEPISIYADCVTVDKKDKNFDITLNFANNPGVTNLGFNVYFDESAMRYTGASYGEIFDESEVFITSNDGALFVSAFNGLEDKTGNGEFVTLAFELTDYAKPGDYDIIIDCSDEISGFYNVFGEEIAYVIEPCYVTVTGEYIPDAPGDDTSDEEDTTREEDTTDEVVVPQEAFKIYAGNVIADKREEVFQVAIEFDNNPGVTSLGFEVLFDSSVMVCTNVDYGSIFRSSEIIVDSSAGDEGSLFISAHNGLVDKTADGNFVTLTFRLTEAAEVGADYEIILLPDDELGGVYNVMDDAIAYKLESGIVTVIETDGPEIEETEDDTTKETDTTEEDTTTEDDTTKEDDTVFEEDVLVIYPAAVTVSNVDETVDVQIKFANNPGVTNLGFEVLFDSSVLIYQNTTIGSIFSAAEVMLDESRTDEGSLFVSAYNGTVDKNKNGTLLTFTFELVDGIELGDYEIQIVKDPVFGGVFNVNDDEIPYEVKTGKVTVEEKKYNIYFYDIDGNLVVESTEYVHGSVVALPAAPAVKGYTFVEWTTGDESFTEDFTAVCDLTLTAVYEANEYTVWFDADGGEVADDSKTVVYDSEYGKLPVATRDGYEFIGWFADDVQITADTKVDILVDQTLTAKWIKLHEIVFATKDGEVVSSGNYKDGETVTLPTAPEVKGYTFAGWSTGDESFTENFTATCDLTLTAVYEANEYTVWFDADGGEAADDSKTVVYDSVYGTLPVATRDGYEFIGWFADDVQITADTKVDILVDQTLTAKWIKLHEIVFVMEDGEVVSSGIYKDGETVTLPTAPEVKGYTYIGWSADGDKLVTENFVATADVTLTAVYERNVITGDVNADGKVDRKDLTRLAQYFARWGAEIDEDASDVNGDGKVDRKDLTRLAQYFARWDVELGK